MCQHRYLSSRVSVLIKMNGCLTTRVVSFNVTLVFIFHRNIPLSQDSTVYKPFLELSVVTISAARANHGLAAFLTFSLRLPLYLSISMCRPASVSSLQSPHCVRNTKGALALSYQLQITLLMSHFALFHCCICKPALGHTSHQRLREAL